MWTNVTPKDETQASSYLIILPIELTIKNVKDIKNELNHAVEQPLPLLIDADGLKTLDTAGLQLLVALTKANKDYKTTWKNVSDSLSDAANTLALSSVLMLP